MNVEIGRNYKLQNSDDLNAQEWLFEKMVSSIISQV